MIYEAGEVAPLFTSESLTVTVDPLGDDRYRLRTPVEGENDRIIDGEAVVLIDEAPA